ncbi:FAD:protein FMN transferase [Geodermatophilus sp. SYSU D00758]
MPADLVIAVMGSTAHVVVVADDPAPLLHRAWERLADLEARWSRFRADSELSALNAAAGRPVLVSPETVTLVSCSVEGWRRTGGLFDPTVHAALVGLGYDRDLGLVQAGGAGAVVATGPAPGCAGIDVDPAASTVRLPPGVAVDPGGIGKGLAADLVAAEVLDAGAAGCLVNVGGDLRAVGEPPTGAGWIVTVPDPARPSEELLRAAVPEGGVATSSRLERRWQAGDTEVHHLVDPSTGAPADGEVVAATVFTARAWEAEVLVKALTVGGRAGFDLLGDAAAVAVTSSGERLSAHVPTAVLR